MPAANPEPPSGGGSFTQNYPIPPTSATPSLRDRILSEISESGPMPFPRYLEIVLYDPLSGYYAAKPGRIGKRGDFYTSVSVGDLFGRILARRCARWWEENSRPASWRVLELGAHDGSLAADILSELQSFSPEALKALTYSIAEPLPNLRAAQNSRLRDFSGTVEVVPSLSSLTPLPGIFLSNELLDALPFHPVVFRNGLWQELGVGPGLSWVELQIEPGSPLSASLEILGVSFPEGYRTEVRTCHPGLLSAITSTIPGGTLLFADYGYASPEYYDKSRTSGTLRTFQNHRAAENPLRDPGVLDITAHVDFTDLSLAARSIGYEPTVFSSQGAYLTNLAIPLLKRGCSLTPSEISQFRTLTHPAHLGSRFHIIEFEPAAPPDPIILHRLALPAPSPTPPPSPLP